MFPVLLYALALHFPIHQMHMQVVASDGTVLNSDGVFGCFATLLGSSEVTEYPSPNTGRSRFRLLALRIEGAAVAARRLGIQPSAEASNGNSSTTTTKLAPDVAARPRFALVVLFDEDCSLPLLLRPDELYFVYRPCLVANRDEPLFGSRTSDTSTAAWTHSLVQDPEPQLVSFLRRWLRTRWSPFPAVAKGSVGATSDVPALDALLAAGSHLVCIFIMCLQYDIYISYCTLPLPVS